MAVRSRAVLRRDQEELLFRWRLAQVQQAAPTEGEISAMAGPVVVWARVTEVVTGDGQYGPHLRVRPQTFSGAPPVAADASTVTLRAYPVPGRSVSDYAVDGLVKLVPARGALFVEKPV